MHPSDTIFILLLITGVIEHERRFLSNIRSDWLDDVMIEDNSPGTCEWVLYSQAFQAWLSGSERVLWIQGNAGAGKTVLAKFLYRQLCDAFAGDALSSGAHTLQWASSASKLYSRPRQVLAYFLDVNSPSRNSGLSVLHSLLYQLLSTEQELFRYVHGKPIFSQPQRGNFGQYAEVLSAILRDPSLKGTIIVLDALDECEPASQLNIIDTLLNLADQSSIQLLVTSRPNQDAKPSLMLDLSQSVEHVEVDIKGYVQTAIRQLTLVREFSSELRDEITRKILAHSSEGFLWVQLVLQSISKARTARMIRDRLERLPQDLRQAYSDSLDGSTGFIDINMRRTLYFVVIVEAPLQIKELSALLALSQCWDSKRQTKSTEVWMTLNLKDITENQTMNFERDFKNHFQPLLSLNESSVSLVHYSLREFLELPTEIDKFHRTFDLQKFEVRNTGDLRNVHGTMAALCLQYILAAFQGHDDPIGFLDFACFQWTEHARKAGGIRSFHLDGLVTLLFSEKTDYASSWLRRIACAQVTRVPLLPYEADIGFIFAAFDLGSHFGKMLGISVKSLESMDRGQRTPLHLAAANNSLSSVRWIESVLVTAGKCLGDLAVRKDSEGESPISLAARNGHEEVMKLLLESLESKYEFDSRLFKTIADSGNVDMFENLYHYTNIKTSDQGMSLLTDVAGLNSVRLIEKISSNHGKPETRQDAFAASYDSNGVPLLHVALRKQAFEVLTYLLDRGYPPTVTDRDGNTALHISAQEGNIRVARVLIETGVSVNSVNGGGETALHIASRIGLPSIVLLLCDHEANVNLAGPFGCLPVHLAAETGQEELINILLHCNTNISATDNTGRSALHVAAGAGQESTLAALLKSGADVSVQDDEGRTPVHYAVQSGNVSILYMLCEAGADLSASEYSGIAPLHLAAEHGSEILVRELIRLGTNPNQHDSEGRTPLHYGCRSHQPTFSAVKLLIEDGAQVDEVDHHGQSPLHHACLSKIENEDVVRILLENGADVNRQTYDRLLPLHYALKEGKPRITKLLRDYGALASTVVGGRPKSREGIGLAALNADEVAVK